MTSPRPLHRIGVASRWCNTSSVVRRIEEPDATVVLMANAYEHGFSVFWPRGSALLMERFAAAWSSATTRGPARMETSFDAVVRDFVDAAEPLREPWAKEDDQGGPAGTLLACALGSTEAHVLWIGDQ